MSRACGSQGAGNERAEATKAMRKGYKNSNKNKYLRCCAGGFQHVQYAQYAQYVMHAALSMPVASDNIPRKVPCAILSSGMSLAMPGISILTMA